MSCKNIKKRLSLASETPHSGESQDLLSKYLSVREKPSSKEWKILDSIFTRFPDSAYIVFSELSPKTSADLNTLLPYFGKEYTARALADFYRQGQNDKAEIDNSTLFFIYSFASPESADEYNALLKLPRPPEYLTSKAINFYFRVAKSAPAEIVERLNFEQDETRFFLYALKRNPHLSKGVQKRVDRAIYSSIESFLKFLAVDTYMFNRLRMEERESIWLRKQLDKIKKTKNEEEAQRKYMEISSLLAQSSFVAVDYIIEDLPPEIIPPNWFYNELFYSKRKHFFPYILKQARFMASEIKSQTGLEIPDALVERAARFGMFFFVQQERDGRVVVAVKHYNYENKKTDILAELKSSVLHPAYARALNQAIEDYIEKEIYFSYEEHDLIFEHED